MSTYDSVIEVNMNEEDGNFWKVALGAFFFAMFTINLAFTLRYESLIAPNFVVTVIFLV